jgi:hypothetical protein
LNHRMSAEDRDTKDKRGKAGIPDDEDRTKLRKKRWRIGLVSTGRGDWIGRPIPRITTKYKENRRWRKEDRRRRWMT